MKEGNKGVTETLRLFPRHLRSQSSEARGWDRFVQVIRRGRFKIMMCELRKYKGGSTAVPDIAQVDYRTRLLSEVESACIFS